MNKKRDVLEETRLFFERLQSEIEDFKRLNAGWLKKSANDEECHAAAHLNGARKMLTELSKTCNKKYLDRSKKMAALREVGNGANIEEALSWAYIVDHLVKNEPIPNVPTS